MSLAIPDRVPLRVRWCAIAAFRPCQLALVLAPLAGCIRSEPTHFYLLQAQTATTVATAPARSAPQELIGIGPVFVPDYLARPEIVTRIAPMELTLSEFHQWAQPLEESIATVVAEDLRAELGTDRIVAFPWTASAEPDLTVSVTIRRFDADEKGKVTLTLDTARRRSTDSRSTLQTFSLSTQAAGIGLRDIVQAHSLALADFSRQLAHLLVDEGQQAETNHAVPSQGAAQPALPDSATDDR